MLRETDLGLSSGEADPGVGAVVVLAISVLGREKKLSFRAVICSAKSSSEKNLPLSFFSS